MRLYITQKDFDKGAAMNCYRCPVARSANRLAKRYGYGQASVGPDAIYFEVLGIGGMELSCTCYLPKKVSLFIREFDMGMVTRRSFKPFSFPIQNIPDLTAGNPG